jgi:hypothetical protein
MHGDIGTRLPRARSAHARPRPSPGVNRRGHVGRERSLVHVGHRQQLEDRWTNAAQGLPRRHEVLRKPSMTMWETPSFVEVDMSAEIGGYQGDDGQRPDHLPEFIEPNRPAQNDA